jgi:hypothetical protein
MRKCLPGIKQRADRLATERDARPQDGPQAERGAPVTAHEPGMRRAKDTSRHVIRAGRSGLGRESQSPGL